MENAISPMHGAKCIDIQIEGRSIEDVHEYPYAQVHAHNKAAISSTRLCSVLKPPKVTVSKSVDCWILDPTDV